ncbi:hypothetical protein Aperf_G00000040321 [Anoplocephala perfoliata]
MSVDHRDALLWPQKDNCNQEDYSIGVRAFLDHSISDISCKAESLMGCWSGSTPVKDSSPSSTEPTSMLSDKSSSRGTVETKNSENTCFSTDTEHPTSEGSLSPPPSQFPAASSSSLFSSTSNTASRGNSVTYDQEVSNAAKAAVSLGMAPRMAYKDYKCDSSISNSAEYPPMPVRQPLHDSPNHCNDSVQYRPAFSRMNRPSCPQMLHGCITDSDYYTEGRRYPPVQSPHSSDDYQPKKSPFYANEIYCQPALSKCQNSSYLNRPQYFWKANNRPHGMSTSPQDFLEMRRRYEMQQMFQNAQINRRFPSTAAREFYHQFQGRMPRSHYLYPDTHNRFRGPSVEYGDSPKYAADYSIAAEVGGRFSNPIYPFGDNLCGPSRFFPPYPWSAGVQHYYSQSKPFPSAPESTKKRNSSPRSYKRKRSPSGSDTKFSQFRSNAEAYDSLALSRLLSVNASQCVSWPELENPIDIYPPEPALRRKKLPCHAVSSNPELAVTTGTYRRKYSSLPFILRSPAVPTPQDIFSYLCANRKTKVDLRHNLLSEALSDAISRSHDSRMHTVPPSPTTPQFSPDPLNLFTAMRKTESTINSPSSDILLPSPKRRRISRSVIDKLQNANELETKSDFPLSIYSKHYVEERLTMDTVRSAVTFVQICQHCKMQILFANDTTTDSSSEETFCSEACRQNYLQSVSRLHRPPLSSATGVFTHPSAIGVPVLLQSLPSKLCKNKPQTSSMPKSSGRRARREAFLRTTVRRWKGSRWFIHSLAKMTRTAGSSTAASSLNASLESITPAFELLRSGPLPKCVLCKCDSDTARNAVVGRLLNYACDKWVHANCILWCYGVSETVNGCFMNAAKALNQAKDQVCKECSLPGAGLPCFAAECADFYHVYCAYSGNCTFYENKSMYCPKHKDQAPPGPLLNSFEVDRKVYLERDEFALVEQVIASQCLTTSVDRLLLRVGTLVLNSIGQLLPEHLDSGRFHTPDHIYPVGFSTTRIYWSFRRPRHRCHYFCKITDSNQQLQVSDDDNVDFLDDPPSVHPSPIFTVIVKEHSYPDTCFKASNCNTVWQHILRLVHDTRQRSTPHVRQVTPETMCGEWLFGLNEPHIVRAIESLPGVEHIPAHAFKFGRMELISRMPVMINPTGCARSEPKRRNYLRTREQEQDQSQLQGRIPRQNSAFPSLYARSLRPLDHIPRYCSSPITSDEPAATSSIQSSILSTVVSASSKYRALQSEWRYNVALARSKIQGLGLFASRDIERNEFIIEYVGQLIRNEVGNKRERLYESQGRGIYMFRVDEEWIVDATMYGGLARYINHSCDPNCVAEVICYDNQKHIVIIAKRLIKKGEELTYDYKLDVESDKNNRIPCLCGSQFCRQWMN